MPRRMPLGISRTREGVSQGRRQSLQSCVQSGFAGTSRGSKRRRAPAHNPCTLSYWALSPTLSSDGFGTPAPDYLGTETLTLQKERPFHHGPVHGPRRFLQRFLALRAGGRSWGGAGRGHGSPAPSRDSGPLWWRKKQEGRGGGTPNKLGGAPPLRPHPLPGTRTSVSPKETSRF